MERMRRRWAEASSHSSHVDHADRDFIQRVKESERQGCGFQKKPLRLCYGRQIRKDRLGKGKGKSRETQAEASALVKVMITGTPGHLHG